MPQPDVAEEAMPCIGCGGPAEPEQDGQVTYYACLDAECGQEFGHEVRRPDGPVCAAGLPIAVAEPEDRSVFLGSTISRRPQ